MSGYCYNLGQAFRKVAEQHANKAAVYYTSENKSYTFSELNKWSDNFANYLAKKGIKQGQVVAIFNDKSIYGFSMMLACIKSGIIYTNLDPESPAERLEKILQRCKPAVVFSDEYCFEKVSVLSHPIQKLTEIEEGHEVFVPLQEITGNNPAYIMFTSGSTGFPKGAVMTHANLLNLIQWAQTTFNIGAEDKCTNVNPVYFDNSVFDFYSAVFNGACLVPFRNEEVKNPSELVKKVDQAGCSVWFSVPSMLVYLLTNKALHAEAFQNMRNIIFGGEGFPKPKLKKLHEILGHRVNLFNVYGPTECTCICSSYLISERDFENMDSLAPLGKLAPNFSYEILPSDENDKSTGELCLKGPNVGAGYFNDIERTTISFIQNPFQNDYTEIVYKTGDLVKLDEKGDLHFMGRADNQIKHMGYRIELEEIESCLNTVEGVKEAAVVYQKLGEGLGNIMAFVAGEETLNKQFVMQEIKNKVPDYMVPKKVFVKPVLPKNSNGKIDRIALKQEL